MVEMRETLIASRWKLLLPEHRAVRPEWPHWERERLDAMFQAIRPTDTVVYCGVEEGDLAALVSTWCARLHMFEPNDRVWPNVRAIWEANNLTPPAGCWSGFAGQETAIPGASWPVLTNHWPPSAYGPVIGDHGFCQLCERPDLPTVSLDDYAAASGDPPDVITMDVEGSELRVLRGAKRLLQESRPVVFVSVHPESMAIYYGDYENELHHYMAQLGYEAGWLAHDHETHICYQHPETARLSISRPVVSSL